MKEQGSEISFPLLPRDMNTRPLNSPLLGIYTLEGISLPFLCSSPKIQLTHQQKTLWESVFGLRATLRVGSGERYMLRAHLQSWRVLYLRYLVQNIWHKINRAWRRLQMGKQFLDP